MTLEKLYSIIEDRLINNSSKSYVASLAKKGNDRVIQKVGEEAIELIIAAKNSDRTEVVAETADLLFHLLILLSTQKISLKEIFAELEKRSQKSK
ncbi:MAG: phosphoribosyl-ATP diphosphatase [Candidatus Roizmanbacteria bacterium]|nr:phosphoribosyl-ATP diphosphatase [Candidatus Roizmanbacteria bacterium]